jgi:predicted nucleotidyltransferase
MPADAFVPDVIWTRIDRTLDRIERERDVRILLAVESGSRAWRFPSPDSDYDVRFIYMHPAPAYLSIEPSGEVIECGLDDPLDVSGWDLRKALRLLVKSNAVLLEWLASPVRYRDRAALTAPLLALAREACHPPALAYHYHHLARRSFDEVLAFPEATVPMKAYCYALRAALALLWMRRQAGPPPMDMPALLQGTDVPEDLGRAIAKLIESKALAREDGTTARIPALDMLISDSLVESVGRFTLPDRASVLSESDRLFRRFLLTGGAAASLRPGLPADS